MDNLKELQNFLKRCIRKGREPFDTEYTKINLEKDCVELAFFDKELSMYMGNTYSYHDLFAKGSLLMEYVKRKELVSSIKLVNGPFAKFIAHSGDSDFSYIMMSSMRAEEKVQRFLDNALLPV